MELLISPIDKKTLGSEVTALSAADLLTARGVFEVYLTKATQSPALLREIGRLHELTFHSVGEGTGKTLDIDKFDEYFAFFLTLAGHTDFFDSPSAIPLPDWSGEY